MKDKLGHIAIGLFIVNNTVFDLVNVSESVFMSVMFFALLYLSLMIWTVKEYWYSREYVRNVIIKIKGDLYFLVIASGLGVRVIWELYKGYEYWGDYDGYMTSVNSFEKGLLITFFMIASLLIVVTNGRNKNNN